MNVTFLVAGVAGLAFSVVLYQKIRSLRLMAILLGVVSLAVVVMGVRPDLLKVSIPVRIRLVMLTISFVILYTTLEAVRRASLKERYALLWVGTSSIFLLFALQPNLIEWLVKITGMHYISAIVVMVFTFLILLAFHVSLALSRYDDDRRVLTQEIALLRKRIESLEARSSGDAAPEARRDPADDP